MRFKRGTVLVILSFLLIMLMTGCKGKKVEVAWETKLNDTTLLKIDKETVSINEARLILLNYRNLYVNALGREIIGEAESDRDFEEYIRKIVLSELAKMKTMVVLAKERGIELTDEEITAADKAADVYYGGLSGEERDYIDLSKSEIAAIYRDYALAAKLYATLSGGVNAEVSDDDARVMIVQQIVVATKLLADKVSDKLANGADFTEVANVHSEVSSREFRLYRQDMSDVVYAALSTLNDGAISSCIKENDKFIIYHVISKIDRELTEENKLAIVRERAKAAFDDVYEDAVSNMNSTYNETLFNELLIEADVTCETSDFFSVFKKYFAKYAE
ncbi:MAG: hypothetical protein IJT81_01445 [Lachnospiraceae bacterium]|nr:hypothetical protein [Lachnospiraceae bacterium]